MSLATKYRPKNFSEVYGQDIVVNTLQKEVENNSIKQSYLFVGGSGAGKTTTARILANTIDSYIIEIDAASNNSAESMRTLINSVKTKSLTHRYTVIILDEMHILSQNAVQTLLKILEQPPKHLIFILCTTDVEKVPQTIYNRCEVFEFITIPVDKIEQRLTYICDKEGFEYKKEAITMIANMADGSMRQAISYLEQCSTLPITVAYIKKVLLADSYDNYLNLVYAILDKEHDKVVQFIKDVYNIDRYIMGLFSFILDMSIYSITKNPNLISIPSVYTEDFDTLNKTDIAKINRLRNVLLDLQFEGRDNPILKQLLIARLYQFMEE